MAAATVAAGGDNLATEEGAATAEEATAADALTDGSVVG